MAEIFISYAKPDEATVRRMAVALQADGYGVWWDRTSVPPNVRLDDHISDKLEAADACVIVWSAEAARSDWVYRETQLSYEASKLVIVRLDEAPLPGFVRDYPTINLSGWAGARTDPHWLEVLSAVTQAMRTVASRARYQSIGDIPAASAPPPRAPQLSGFQRTALIVGGLALVVVAALLVLSQMAHRSGPSLAQGSAEVSKPAAPSAAELAAQAEAARAAQERADVQGVERSSWFGSWSWEGYPTIGWSLRPDHTACYGYTQGSYTSCNYTWRLNGRRLTLHNEQQTWNGVIANGVYSGSVTGVGEGSTFSLRRE